MWESAVGDSVPLLFLALVSGETDILSTLENPWAGFVLERVLEGSERLWSDYPVASYIARSIAENYGSECSLGSHFVTRFLKSKECIICRPGKSCECCSTCTRTRTLILHPDAHFDPKSGGLTEYLTVQEADGLSGWDTELDVSKDRKVMFDALCEGVPLDILRAAQPILLKQYERSGINAAVAACLQKAGERL